MAAATRLIAVRFGNVLGSSGSVVPKFKAQIARGGPVTVTHPDMVRYFMTVREAADSSSPRPPTPTRMPRPTARVGHDERASVYVLKMGQPVRIIDLAERMIRLAGFEPGEDIEIVVTGTRPGERLHEILFAREEPMADTGIDGVMAAKPVFADRPRVEAWLRELERAVAAGWTAPRPSGCSRRRSRSSGAGRRASRQRCQPNPWCNWWNPSQASERCGTGRRASRQGAHKPRRGRRSGRRGLDQARGDRDQAGLAAKTLPHGGDHLRHGQRLRIGDDQRPSQRRGRAQHRVDGRDKVVDGQQRAPRREPPSGNGRA